MIRLTWRQFRSQAIIATGVLVIATILLVLNGRELYHLYNTTVANCSAQGDCQTAQDHFLNNYVVLRQLLGLLLLIVPALIGIFWGAPLVAHEYERGTFRLAWTQSITRRRWLLVKLSLTGLASVIVAGVLSLLYTWWSRPFERITMDRFIPGTFDERGVVVIGYALFAFALGLTAGVVIHRILPAMATTLTLFVGVRLAEASWIRPHLLSPVRQTKALVVGPTFGIAQGGAGGPFFVIPPTPKLPNAWIYSNVLVDKAGHAPTSQFLRSACPALIGGIDGAGSNIASGQVTPSPGGVPMAQQVHACATAIAAKFHQVVTYQPADRFWAFQGIETALFVALALLLMAFSFWWIRQGLS